MTARRLFLCTLLGIALLAGPSHAADKPVIAAAADLNAALPEIVALFAKAAGREVDIAFGSSGNFTQQIEQGAPFQIFLSADETYVTRLAAAGKTVDGGVLYAVGRIGIFTPHCSALKPDGALADLAAALADGRLKRFAIANPEHAPYGRAAREALMHAGLWDKIAGHLVLGENVAQATQFAASDSAQGGIIPLSLARTPAIAAHGSFALLPADWHAPLRQRMVLLTGAGETARQFYAFIQSPAARAVLIRYGFAPPGETS